MIKISTDICSNFVESTSREWLETNGLGGYASGTISGTNTRRYHGLLVAATDPPVGRDVLLSKFEETLIVNGERFDLSSNQYPGVVHPHGYRFLASFRLDPFPVWNFKVGSVELQKTIFMVHGENSTVIEWVLIKSSRNSNSVCHLETKPLLAFRNHHHLRTSHSAFRTDVVTADGNVSMKPEAELPRVYFAHNARSVEYQGHWYRNFEYAIERERGFDYREDLYQPLGLTFDLKESATVIVTTESKRRTSEIPQLRTREIRRRTDLIIRSGIKDKALWPLVLAADQFIVARGTGKTVLAGYHWFSDWGRDTMIALSGLTLSTNRPEIARSILLEFSKHISEGMIPNRFPDSGAFADYNTVDATLWYFEALRAYVAKTGDLEFIRNGIYDKLAEVIEWHLSGTRYGIHVDTDGLLSAGETGVQLTWMDAKIDEWVVTPRIGKPVEIQALWYNALRIMADLSVRLGEVKAAANYNIMADTARASFNGQFWNSRQQCLYDAVNGDDKDGSVRPNQILAVSLPNTMLDQTKAKLVVDKVEMELLTPFGLRSLSPSDKNYAPFYLGTPIERDAAYHQGTVWAWLIGPFIDAYRRVHTDDAQIEARVGEMTTSLKAHLTEAMVGQVSEIFDAEPPFRARGCAAQAWSVAELLRVLARNSSKT